MGSWGEQAGGGGAGEVGSNFHRGRDGTRGRRERREKRDERDTTEASLRSSHTFDSHSTRVSHATQTAPLHTYPICTIHHIRSPFHGSLPFGPSPTPSPARSRAPALPIGIAGPQIPSTSRHYPGYATYGHARMLHAPVARPSMFHAHPLRRLRAPRDTAHTLCGPVCSISPVGPSARSHHSWFPGSRARAARTAPRLY